jgi:hypothetical protein
MQSDQVSASVAIRSAERRALLQAGPENQCPAIPQSRESTNVRVGKVVNRTGVNKHRIFKQMPTGNVLLFSGQRVIHHRQHGVQNAEE